MPNPGQGCVYLLHFSKPYQGKTHYLGWTNDLPGRLRDHYYGNGASVPLVKAAYAAGVRFRAVRWMPGDRHLEAHFHYHGEGKPGRAVKGRHGLRTSGAKLCPVCAPARYGHGPYRRFFGLLLPAGWMEGTR
jgi:hypothetical protein